MLNEINYMSAFFQNNTPITKPSVYRLSMNILFSSTPPAFDLKNVSKRGEMSLKNNGKYTTIH